MIFPINRSKYRILKEIYTAPGINVSELIKKANVSSAVCYAHLKDLNLAKVIKENFIGKKPQIREIYPNLETENGKLIFSLIENQIRLDFFKKYKNLDGCFSHLTRNLPENILTIVIFGSYARFAETKESDLDLFFIISSKRWVSKLETLIEEAFVTFEKDVSWRVMRKEEFLKAAKHDALIKSVIREHVCVYNSINFIELLSRIGSY